MELYKAYTAFCIINFTIYDDLSIKTNKITPKALCNKGESRNFASEIMGKCYTASSLRIPQGLTAARVVGCSSAMW